MSGHMPTPDQAEGLPVLIKLPEAARLSGIPYSTLKKTFIREEKRPKNIPGPPPHRRIGRSIFILADKLSDWVSTLNEPAARARVRSRGRPTVAERVAWKNRSD